MNNQHRFGQHYSKEEKLIIPYQNILLKQKNNTVVDPFVGEGHLLFFYLNLFDFNTQEKLLKEKKIIGKDIYEKNIINLRKKFKEFYNLEDELLNELFQIEDSLLNDNLPKNTFILTNPPYLAKNICKKNFPNDFEKYFKNRKKENDYFEIAINKYKHFNGIWIVPANILSSEIMSNTRKNIIKNMTYIYIYEEKTFEDTDITVTTFFLNKNTKNYDELEIIFKNNSTEEKKNFKVNKNHSIVEEWDNIKNTENINNIKQGYVNSKIEKGIFKINVLNEKYKEEEISVSKKDFDILNNNILILRSTDSETDSIYNKIGLYTIEEIWNNKSAKNLITKKSSRTYTPIFLNLEKQEQIILKNKFNEKLNELREKYNSIFLTNFRNSCNGKQKKRISFTSAISLLNVIINKDLK